MATPSDSNTTVLKIDIAASLTTIGQVHDISGPSLSRDMIETSSHDSTYETFVGSLVRGGDVTFTVDWDPDDSTHAALLANLQSGTAAETFQITMGNSGDATIDFDAWVRDLQVSAPVSGVHTADITLKVTGAVTITP